MGQRGSDFVEVYERVFDIERDEGPHLLSKNVQNIL
jgi:hypothetical protein